MICSKLESYLYTCTRSGASLKGKSRNGKGDATAPTPIVGGVGASGAVNGWLLDLRQMRNLATDVGCRMEPITKALSCSSMQVDVTLSLSGSDEETSLDTCSLHEP